MVVEKVVKLVVEVGFLEFLDGKEEEEGSVEVVLLLEMEEEMEGRMVEELVEEMVVEMEGGRLKEGTAASLGCWFVCLLLEMKKERKNNERERKKGGVYIKESLGILQICHPTKMKHAFHSKNELRLI